MKEKNLKYGWLVDKIKAGEANYVIADTERSHGAISCPTGYGKSAIIFQDILYRIKETLECNDRIVINLCTPIINLCVQQGLDFIEVFEHVYNDLYKDFDKSCVRIFNNNSGVVSKIYINDNSNPFIDYEYDCYNFAESFTDYFINDEDCKIAFIISCNKSMWKFIEKFRRNDLLGTAIITYLDEAHTISIEETPNNDTDKIDLMTLGRICSNLYLVSATHKRNIVSIVNSYNGVNTDNYIYEITPAQAIKENVICSPLIGYHYEKDGLIDVTICRSFMKQVQNANRKIYHKILVTCNDTAHLFALRETLVNDGFQVFSTSNNDGMNTASADDIECKDATHTFDNIKSFISEINNYKGHCFVLHIKQMISGIDVPCLTDAIISKNETNPNDNSFINVIQTIGRTLRLGSERDKCLEQRKKQFANILFITKPENETIKSDLNKFFISYYGINNIRFNKDYSSEKYTGGNKVDVEFTAQNLIKGSNTYQYHELLVDIEDYIKQHCLVNKTQLELCGLDYKSLLYEKDLAEMRKKYTNVFNPDGIDLSKYFIDDGFNAEVEELLRKYGII